MAGRSPRTKRRTPTANAERVGIAELRAHLAKYLERAAGGTPVIIQERGRNAYVLLRFEDADSPRAFGCMRARTEYVEGALVGATEDWAPGDLP